MALADEDDEVVGAVRFLVPGRAGLKTLDDVGPATWGVDALRAGAAAGIDPATTWDCATMGLRPSVTESRVRLSLALYHGLLLALRVNKVHTVVAILDERVRRLLSSVGLILHPIPGTAAAPYLGSSASTPVYAHLAAGLDDQRRIAPDAHRLVTLGVGLDGISVPEPPRSGTSRSRLSSGGAAAGGLTCGQSPRVVTPGRWPAGWTSSAPTLRRPRPASVRTGGSPAACRCPWPPAPRPSRRPRRPRPPARRPMA